MTSHDLQLPSPALPLNQSAALYEKSSTSVSTENRPVYLDSEKASSSASNPSAYSDTALLNGEPIVTNGEDVSRFVVDIRDDGESALTFRSILLGTVFAGLGAALSQVFACFYVTEFGFDLVPRFCPDICFQATSSLSFDCVHAASYLHFWSCLGN